MVDGRRRGGLEDVEDDRRQLDGHKAAVDDDLRSDDHRAGEIASHDVSQIYPWISDICCDDGHDQTDHHGDLPHDVPIWTHSVAMV